MSMVKVAIHYDTEQHGFVTYDSDTKTVTVELPEQAWADKVLAFLKQDHSIANAIGLADYEMLDIQPLESVESFKLALTRLWEATEVHVDWSRPVEA